MQNQAKYVHRAIALILITKGIGLVHAASTTTVDPIQKTTPYCGYRSSESSALTTGVVSPVEGRRAFMRMNCYSCHGSDAHGAGMGPSLIGKANSVDVIFQGDGHGMPGYQINLCAKIKSYDGKTLISNNDAANLKQYLLLLGTSQESTLKFTNWWKDNTPDQ